MTPNETLQPHRSGFLAAVEGIDGAGKSTLVRRLADHARSLRWTVVLSREPTDGVHGRALRESGKTGRLSLEDELELFLADRAEHVEQVIAPALARGEMVLLDRYYLSTAAYQGARGADPQTILLRNEAFAPKPDLVLLLDVDPALGSRRILRRGDTPDDFEAVDYLGKVRRIFLGLTRPFIRVVDADQPAEIVFSECVRHFEEAAAATLATSRQQH